MPKKTRRSGGKRKKASPDKTSKTESKPQAPEPEKKPAPTKPRRTKPRPMLFEIAWETCQQVGGIYTVIRSKAPSAVDIWGKDYFLVGPYNPDTSPLEFEAAEPEGPIAKAIEDLRNRGISAHFGHWLVTGRPQVILLDPTSAMPRLAEIKYLLWEHHHISLESDPLVDSVVAFGDLVGQLFDALLKVPEFDRRVLAHFHEWMAGAAIPELRRSDKNVSILFTTHATILGRFLATGDKWFYDHLPFVDWAADAKRLNILPQVLLERAAAHGAHVFTTVSPITALECEHLLGRKPDTILPNGLNIEKFVAIHEFQNLHREYKAQIAQFVMAHFFPSYTFDLDETLFFFTSGRYEYRNKGLDMTLEALARLNAKMKAENIDKTVVFFIVTRRPYSTVHPQVLHSRAVMEEMRNTCLEIQRNFGGKLFEATTYNNPVDLEKMLDERSWLKLRRLRHAWRADGLPLMVTHNLQDDAHDDVLNQLRYLDLINRQEDPVKVVYIPEFIRSTDPLFGMDYDQFVRGCHMGVFPSFYEPWGYTPLECIALGVPAISSDLAGFGAYIMQKLPHYQSRGISVVQRRYSHFDVASEQLAEQMLNFTRLNRRERIAQRNLVESSSGHFDWSNLGKNYAAAHQQALEVSG
ncbi:MAG: glycogen synthase [Phycisphaerae bacterium]